MSFSRYPKYKASGVEWLGEVPEGWVTCALKRIVNMQSGESITAESITETGAYPVFGGNGLRGYTSAFTHNGKFVLIGRQGALCGNINYASKKFWASEHAIVVTPTTSIDSVWLGEMLRSMNLNQYSIAAAQPGLSVDLVGRLGLAIPPLPEQTAIAAFLDRETLKVDELVAEQRRLMELLKEKRQAVISHAVTKGLNPHAPMKPSGIEWLGDVPAVWKVVPLGILVIMIQTGPFGSQLHSAEYVENGTPVINPSNIQEGRIEPDWSCSITPENVGRLSQHKLMEGDIVFGRRGEMGRCALVSCNEIGWICGTGSLNIRLSNRAFPPFIATYLRTEYVREWLKLQSVGSTMDNLNTQILGAINVPLPPLEEQKSIASFIDTELTKFDTLTAEAQRAIDLLQERRTALISAAVTGQIDVRPLTRSAA